MKYIVLTKKNQFIRFRLGSLWDTRDGYGNTWASFIISHIANEGKEKRLHYKRIPKTMMTRKTRDYAERRHYPEFQHRR